MQAGVRWLCRGAHLGGGCGARPLGAGLGMHGQRHAVRAAQGAAGAHEGGPGRVLQGLQAQLLAPIAPVRQLPRGRRLHVTAQVGWLSRVTAHMSRRKCS